MKKTFFIFTLLLFLNSYAQDKRIIGKWQVVSIDNGEFFYNIENDSLILHEIIKNEYNKDISKIDNLKEMSKMIYFSIIFIFGEDGKYIQKSDLAEINLNFIVNKEKNIILLFEDINNTDKNKSEVHHKILDEKLYLEFNDTESSTNLY